jgi:outer membrane biosynthesis protein TonB
MSTPRTSAVLAPFAALARDLVGLVANRTAFAGGVAGTGAITAAAVALAALGPSLSDAREPEDDELAMAFMPGALVRKGPARDPTEIPEKEVVDRTRAAGGAPPTTITTDDTPVATPDTPKPPRPDRPRSTETPDKPDGREDVENREPNTPHNDRPTVDKLAGDPFGSPDGWSDRVERGDAWATAVLAALNKLTVGSYAGLGQDATFKFQLVICADGRIDGVRVKQSTGKPDFDGQIRNALESLKIPRAPADVAAQLAGKCKKLPYEFTWSGKSANGSVR